MHYFEVYVLRETLTQKHWQKLYDALVQYGGRFNKFQIILQLTDNVVRFFVISNKDLSVLSNNLEGFVLRPVEKTEIDLPSATAKEHFVQFVGGGSLLDLKEKYSVKKGKHLQYAEVNVRTINKQKAVIKLHLYFQNSVKQWFKSTKYMGFFPKHLLAVDFASNTHYMRKTVPKYLNIEKSLQMLVSDKLDPLFEVDTFPYFSHNYYLNLTNYDFDKHSFIIGASGSGKSKLITLLVDRLSRTALKMNYRVVIIDPHAAIADDFSHISQHQVIRFGKQDSTDLFPGAGADLTAATELTAVLFKSILADQFNPRLDRLLRFSLFVLMTAQTMSLENFKRFLTDVEYRNQIVEHTQGYVPQNVVKFFGADFNEFRTQFYNQTILPLVSMVEEMQLQPSLVGESEISLAKTIQDNFLTVFSLNKVSMGEKVVKTVAGLLIQQIFLLAQARTFGQKIILIIDEVSVVQNPALAQILAEARKFNLTVMLSQQYFGQIEKDLRDAIFANVFNYYAFKVSEDDARALEGNLNIELPKELIEEEATKGVKESEIKVKIMTELHPRECLVRLLHNGQIAPAIKARTVDAPVVGAKHDKKQELVEQKLPKKFVEGAEVHKKKISFSKEFIEQLADSAERGEIIKSDEGHLPARRGVGSLRDLLAIHSSSRSRIAKKEKD